MKNIAKIAILLALCLVMTACSGGGIDAGAYMNLELQSTYLNNHTQEFIDMLSDDVTVEDLEEMYYGGVEAEVDFFLGYYLEIYTEMLSQETIDRANTLFDQIYTNTKYEIGEVRESGSNYEVDITIYPIDIIEKVITVEFVTEALEAVYSQEGADEMAMEELEEQYTDIILTALEENLAAIGHLEPVTITALIIGGDSYYELNDTSWQEIDTYIISYGSEG